MVQPAVILLGTRFIQYHSRGSHSRKSHSRESHSRGSHSRGLHSRESYSRESHSRGSHSRRSHSQESESWESHSRKSHSRGSHIWGSHSQGLHNWKSHSFSTFYSAWRQALVVSLHYSVESGACDLRAIERQIHSVWLAVYVYVLGVSNRCPVSKYGKYCLYFGDLYAPGIINHQYYSYDIKGFPGASIYNTAHPPGPPPPNHPVDHSFHPMSQPRAGVSAQPHQYMPPGFGKFILFHV